MLSTCGDVIRNNAYKFPDDCAYKYNGAVVTFAQQLERGNRLGAALWANGLRCQDRISVLSQNSLEFMDVYAACELAGYIMAAVNWRLAPPEVEWILNNATPRVLVFEAQYSELVDRLRPRLNSVELFLCIGGGVPDWATAFAKFAAAGDAAGAPSRPSPDEVMQLVYTSGTTGRPKGVMRSHRAEIAVANLVAAELGFIVSDKVQLMMPFFHVGARYLQMAAHLRGCSVVMHREFRPPEILRTIVDERVSITHMAPTMIQALLDQPGIDDMDLSSLQTVCYSAAPMPLPLLERGLRMLGPVFLQLYGMTEGAGTTLHKRQHKPDGSPEELKWLTSVGQAAPGVELKIVDQEGSDLPSGQLGEIITRTETHMLGYWNNTAATIEVLRKGWYYTGDLGILDERGFLYLVDRKKDMIISGGENIYSREVEDAVAAHPAVVEVAVIGVKDSYWGETVRAICSLKPDETVTEADIIEHCKGRIANYKRPKSVIFLQNLPKLASGKYDKVSLRSMYGGAESERDK